MYPQQRPHRVRWQLGRMQERVLPLVWRALDNLGSLGSGLGWKETLALLALDETTVACSDCRAIAVASAPSGSPRRCSHHPKPRTSRRAGLVLELSSDDPARELYRQGKTTPRMAYSHIPISPPDSPTSPDCARRPALPPPGPRKDRFFLVTSSYSRRLHLAR